MSENENVEVLAGQFTEQSDLSTDTKITQLVAEIKDLKDKIGENVIEIGVKLLEVRELLKKIKKGERGSWGDWLKSNVDFTHQTANKFMKCAERFKNYAPARHLNSSQMFELLSLPSAEETAKFVDTKNSESNPVENMKKMELREEIKKWKEGDKSANNPPGDNREIIDTKDFKSLKRIFKMSSELSNSEKFEDLIQKYVEQNHDTFQEDLKILQKIVETFSKNINQNND